MDMSAEEERVEHPNLHPQAGIWALPEAERVVPKSLSSVANLPSLPNFLLWSLLDGISHARLDESGNTSARPYVSGETEK